jgi:hypothetical protein
VKNTSTCMGLDGLVGASTYRVRGGVVRQGRDGVLEAFRLRDGSNLAHLR